MQINIEDFDNVVGGLTALINVLRKRLEDQAEKLNKTKTWEEELLKENRRLSNDLEETVRLNEGIKEEVDRLQRIVDHYQGSISIDSKNQILEGKKQALKLLKNIVSHFGPDDKPFSSGFENAIAHLEGDITRNSCTSQ